MRDAAAAGSAAGGSGEGDDDLLQRALRGGGAAAEEGDVVRVRVYADDVAADDAVAVAMLREAAMARLASGFATPKGYMWTYEPLVLEPLPSEGREACGRAVLGGAARIAAGSAEDAWTIARAIFRLTEAFSALSATVEDGDGQFLLIEAAECLPEWLSPSTADNRTFVRGGKLLLLPPAAVTGRPPPLGDAMRALATGRGEEVVGAAELLDCRMRACATQPHVVRCRVTLGAAVALRAAGGALVGAASEALAQRDPHDVAVAIDAPVARPAPGEKRGDAGGGSPVDTSARSCGELVEIMVPMHRLHYAQTLAQRLAPPKAWREHIPTDAGAARQAALFGMKLCLGLAMAAANDVGADADVRPGLSQEVVEPGQGEVDAAWEALVRSLEAQGRLEGKDTEQRARALSRARARFDASTGLALRQRAALRAPGALVRAAVVAADSGSIATADVAPAAALRESDSDAWLYLNEEELTHDLEARRCTSADAGAGNSGRGSASDVGTTANTSGSVDAAPRRARNAEVSTGADFDVARAAESMRAFMRHASSGEAGAELPGDLGGEVGLDPDAFLREMRSALGLAGGGPINGDGTAGAESSAGETDDEYDADGELIEEDGDAFDREYTRALKAELAAAVPVAEDKGAAGDGTASSSADPKRWSANGASGVPGSGDDVGEGRVGRDCDGGGSDAGEPDEDAPLDVDMDVVKNLLASYAHQGGLPGPASNLLGAMGITLPDDDDVHG